MLKKSVIILVLLMLTTACANSNSEIESTIEGTEDSYEASTYAEDLSDFLEDGQETDNPTDIASIEEDKSAEIIINDYFFAESEEKYTYDVAEFLYEDIEEVSVKVSMEASFDEGNVYSIVIDYEDCPGRYFYGVDRFELGLFYVSKDKVYLLKDNIDEDITKERFIQDGIVVCSNEDYDENYDGEQRTIVNEGDVCIYTSYNTLTESGMYYEYQWTKGEGLTYFKSGYGAEGDPIEIIIDSSSSSDWTNIFGYLDEEQQISLERYLPVLEGNETFFCFDWLDEEISFQEYAESVECIENLNITEIAVLDIDGHDGQELIIHTSDGGGNYLILSEIEDKFYGVNYGERIFMDLQTDGKFYGSGGAGDRYFYKLNITVDGVDKNCFAELHGDTLTVDGETITDYEDWLSENYSNPVGWITFE